MRNEDAIKWLENLKQDIGQLRHENLWPYAQAIDEIITLLEEHEPMMVRLTTSTIRCPKCGKQITSRGAIHREIKFCWKCGQAVKWE